MSLHSAEVLLYSYFLNFTQYSIFFVFIFILGIGSLLAPNGVFRESTLRSGFSLFLLYSTSLIFFWFGYKLLTANLLQESFLDNTCGYTEYQQLFGDTLVLLVLLITFVSWWFLSERYIFKNNFLILYLLVFFFCTINMVSATHLISMFTFFELIFFPSLFFAYTLSYSKKAEKTIEYLVLWTLTGAMIAMVGFGGLLYITGTVDLSSTTSYSFSIVEATVLFFLFFIGFGVKVPVWPFYYWLTKVHVEAPTGFSMFLSGFLVKTAFFCFSQVFYLLSLDLSVNIALSIIIWGICDASARMWSILDIKRLVALATVQEMNMIMLLLFMLSNTNYTVLNGFLFIHGILSVFLFFLVDMVYKQAKTRNLTVLGGLSLTSKSLLTFVWVAILVYRGFPVFAKFFVEWELASILLQNFIGFGFILVLIFNMLGAGSFFKHWTSAAYSAPDYIVVHNTITSRDSAIGWTCTGLLVAMNFLFFLF